ncbi:MAG: hypothetical protein ACFFG0_05070 [Candidatus Thorarchaeota archaeon]
MTEISLKNQIKDDHQLNQLDLLFEIFKQRKTKKELQFKLKNFEGSLKSINTSDANYKFEALKTVINETNSILKNLEEKLDPYHDLFKLSKNLEDNNLFLENLEKERKKRRIDAEHYELTKGYYLQKLIDIGQNFNQLKSSALNYSRELKDTLITFEDRRIVLTTEKMRKHISKDEFKEKLKEIETDKQKIEEKLAFLQVEIIDYNLD